MAHLIHLPNLRDGYITLVNFVEAFGVPVSPRGQTCYEVPDVIFTIDDPTDVLPVGVGRGVNSRLAAIEALQLISGTVNPELLVATAPQFLNFAEPPRTLQDQHRDQRRNHPIFWGAYGSRIGNQLKHVMLKLRADPETRQAVITLWDPYLDNATGKRDYPCTVALGFRLRRTERTKSSVSRCLDLSVTMRSNDVWLGTAYDVFMFTQLQHTLAWELNTTPGRYTHTAWSLHLYDRDLASASNLRSDARRHGPTVPDYPRGVVPGVGLSFIDTAAELLRGTPSPAFNPWYTRQIQEAYANLNDKEDE